MSQRVFQIAKDLRVDSKIIVRKLTHENLPPPGSDPDESGWQGLWTSRSAVTVGQREMIREWHASGELFQTILQTEEPDAGKQGRKSRPRDASVRMTTRERPLAATEILESVDRDVSRQALEAVTQIDREARQKKLEQIEGLRQSRSAILVQIRELSRQISQIDQALQALAGPTGRPTRGYTRTRRDLGGLRERMGAWLESRRGEKFGAGALVQEFPELGNTALSYVLRPLVAAGRIQTDASAGSKRLEYFVPR